MRSDVSQGVLKWTAVSIVEYCLWHNEWSWADEVEGPSFKWSERHWKQQSDLCHESQEIPGWFWRGCCSKGVTQFSCGIIFFRQSELWKVTTSWVIVFIFHSLIFSWKFWFQSWLKKQYMFAKYANRLRRNLAKFELGTLKPSGTKWKRKDDLLDSLQLFCLITDSINEHLIVKLSSAFSLCFFFLRRPAIILGVSPILALHHRALLHETVTYTMEETDKQCYNPLRPRRRGFCKLSLEM